MKVTFGIHGLSQSLTSHRGTIKRSTRIQDVAQNKKMSFASVVFGDIPYELARLLLRLLIQIVLLYDLCIRVKNKRGVL